MPVTMNKNLTENICCPIKGMLKRKKFVMSKNYMVQT